ncbi:MAG: hypothetical protein OEM52_06400 [bacterium]|nr:hypothetical protein [bacterium]
MDLIPILSTVIFIITIITFIVAVASYVVFRLKERRKAPLQPLAPIAEKPVEEPTPIVQPANSYDDLAYPASRQPVAPQQRQPAAALPPLSSAQQAFMKTFEAGDGRYFPEAALPAPVEEEPPQLSPRLYTPPGRQDTRHPTPGNDTSPSWK